MVKAKAHKTEILQAGNPILREVSSAVHISKIKTPEIKKVISLLKDTIKSQADAAAISAVQIGKPIKLFIISKKVFGVDPKKSDKLKIENDLIFINKKPSSDVKFVLSL